MRWTYLVLGVALVLNAAAACAQGSLLGVQTTAPAGTGTGDGKVWTYINGYYADGRPILNAYRRTHGIEIALLKEYSRGLGWRRMHAVVKGRPQDLDALTAELRSRNLLIREERPAVLSLELEYYYTRRGAWLNDRAFYRWDPTHNTHQHPADVMTWLGTDLRGTLRSFNPRGARDAKPDRAYWKLKLLHETEPLVEGAWVEGPPY